MKRDLLLMIGVLPLIGVLLSGCGGGGGGTLSAAPLSLEPAISTREEAMQPGTWTVLVYLDADNDLETAGIHNFNQMETIGSTRDVRVVVQMDRKDGDGAYNDSWTDTRRYLIVRDADTRTMHSLRLDEDQPLGELNMADPQTLRDFVTWGMREFPADHYCLIIWDHGTGWEIRSLSVAPQYKYVVVDSTGGSHQMNINEIASALNGIRLDVLAFDACYMQQLEVAYELKDCADFLVGSTAAEPSPGYNYSRVLTEVSASTSPTQLCQVLVSAFAAEYPTGYEGITLSALNMERIPALADAASSFAQLLTANAQHYRVPLSGARSAALNYSTLTGGSERYSLDLLDYANRCTGVLGAQAVSSYASLVAAVDDAVIAETHNPDTPNAHGVAIYVPSPSHYDYQYGLLRFAQGTYWDDWLQAQRQ